MREDQGSSDGQWSEASAAGDPADPGQRPNGQDQTGQGVDSGAAKAGPTSASVPPGSGAPGPGPSPSGPSPSGQAASGPSPSGQAASGPSPSGQAASGPSPSGQAASGQAASGQAASGQSSPVQSGGQTASGWQSLSQQSEWASPTAAPSAWQSPSGQYPSGQPGWQAQGWTPQAGPGDPAAGIVPPGHGQPYFAAASGGRPDSDDPGRGNTVPGETAPAPDFTLPSYSPPPGFGPHGGSGYGPPGYGGSGYGPPGYGGSGYGGYLPPPGSGSRRRRNLLTYLTVAVVAAAAGAGITGYLVNNSSSSRPAASGVPNGGLGNLGGSLPGGGTGSPAGGVNSATEQSVVSKVRPGLVDISSNLGYQGGQAAATGMVISSNGLVLTNNHVITDTTGLSATVVTTGQHFAAKWIGYNAKDDVAVIKLVGAHNLRTVPLGNSSTVKFGDHVIAMGNAEGAGGAPAVVGSITGMNQTITASDSGAGTSETLHNMLQTNAGIVQGDSGGALASTAGQVIGMNTAAATGSFGSTAQSVGYAIPINTAIRIARQIIAGKPGPNLQIGSTGFMGVLVPAGRASKVSNPVQQRKLQLKLDETGSSFPVQPSSPVCLANDLNAGVPRAVAPVRSGALIIGELCGTPASKAGITPGDVITSVGGKPVTSPGDLTTVMTGLRPGMAIRVDWVAVNGQRHQTTIVLAQAPPH
ncbi:MAG: S1C family serine protease [Streptosporangiaceae bacterium]